MKNPADRAGLMSLCSKKGPGYRLPETNVRTDTAARRRFCWLGVQGLAFMSVP